MQGGIHLIDRNCEVFDISDVFSAFNLATFLLHLSYTHIAQVLGKFDESKRQELITRLAKNEDPSLKWKYIHQMYEPAFKEAKKEAVFRDKQRRGQEIDCNKTENLEVKAKVNEARG